MKKMILGLMMLALLSISVFGLGGSGTEIDPYQITTCADLQDLTSAQIGEYYELMNDIDCSAGHTTIPTFYSTLDGNDYAIIDLNNPLFDTLSVDSVVKNLELKDVYISLNKDKLGSLANEMNGNAIIDNIRVTGTLRNTQLYKTQQGGIIGSMSGGQATNLFFNGSLLFGSRSRYTGGIFGVVSGSSTIVENVESHGIIRSGGYVGGIVGYTRYSTIKNTESNMDIQYYSAYSQTVGGIVGYIRDGRVENSHFRGDVVGSYEVGGIVGRSYNSHVSDCSVIGSTIRATYSSVGGITGYQLRKGSMTNSFVSAQIIGSSKRGMVIGQFRDTFTFDNVFWNSDLQTTPNPCGSGVCDLTEILPKTELELKTESTFVDYDLVDTWYMKGGNFPELRTIPSFVLPYSLEVEITSPNNNTIDNSTPLIEFMVTDSDSLTADCDLYVNGELAMNNPTVDLDVSSSFDYTMNDGLQTFYIECSADSMTANSGVYSIFLDQTYPFIQSLSPLMFNSTVFEDYEMSIAGIVEDYNLSNITVTVWDYDDVEYYLNETTSFADPTYHDYNWLFDTTPTDNGEWSMQIYADDWLSNVNNLWIDFTVDNCVPEWNPEAWTSCDENTFLQTRTHYDINNCEIDWEKPSDEERGCGVSTFWEEYCLIDLEQVEDPTNISGACVGSEHGYIKWLGNINIVGYNLDENINIEEGFVALNKDNLHSSLNTPAEVSFSLVQKFWWELEDFFNDESPQLDLCEKFKLYWTEDYYGNSKDLLSELSDDKIDLMANTNDIGDDCKDNDKCESLTCTDNVLTFQANSFSGWLIDVDGLWDEYDLAPALYDTIMRFILSVSAFVTLALFVLISVWGYGKIKK